MKNILPILALIIFSSISCDQKSSNETIEYVLTEADSIKVIEQVLAASDQFAYSNNNLDVKSMMEYWHYKDPRFIGVENTDFVPSDGLYERVSNFYAVGVDTTNITWVKREIIPITPKFAHLYGEYKFYMKQKSGEERRNYIYYSALLAEINGTWGALRIQESYVDE